jgi:RNA polymerase sigma-70 factor (ECF subfamily)
MNPEQEQHLLKRLRLRDERAFRQLLDLYQNRVYNLIYRLLGDAHEAQDVTQEVFIAVFRSIDQFRGDSQLATWLYRIATNRARNRIKYLAHRRTHPQPDATEDHPHDPLHPWTNHHGDSPDRILIGQEMEAVLQRAISQLDDEPRALIVLRDVEHLSYQEIAEITQLALGTVKSRIHRARLQLKRQLDAYLSGHPVPPPPPRLTPSPPERDDR